MKEKENLLNLLLAALLGLYLLGALLLSVWCPGCILLPWNIPNLVGLSLIVLLVEWKLSPCIRRDYPRVCLLALATFLLLPPASGLVSGGEIADIALVGCLVFTGVSWLFDSAVDYAASWGKSPLAVPAGALGIYLASQALVGIFL